MKTKLQKMMLALCGVMLCLQIQAQTTTIEYTAKQKLDRFDEIQYFVGATAVQSHDFDAETGAGTVIYDGVVTEFGTNALMWNTDLYSIEIPEGVEKLGYQAFYQCSNLTTISLPTTLKEIGGISGLAFDGCTGLANGHFVIKDLAWWCSVVIKGCYSNPIFYAKHIYDAEDNEITDLVIPEDVTSIGDNAFCNCEGLRSVAFHDGVTYIGCSSFANCTGLTAVELPGALNEIGESAFSRCSNLTSVTIPEGVEKIGFCAFNYTGLTSLTLPSTIRSMSQSFHNCEQLKTLELTEGITYLGGSFYSCKSLKEVHISGSIQALTYQDFMHCDSLETVTIDEGVEEVDGFSDCPMLVSLTIPSTTKTIGNFRGCKSLASITSYIKKPFALEGAYFSSISDACVLTVPFGTKDTYFANGWTEDVFKGGVVEGEAPEVEQVHATFENPSNTNTTWDPDTRTFTWLTTYYNQLRNIGLPSGDITKYKKLVVDCSIKEGEQFRVLIYQGGANKTLYAKDGVNEFILVDELKEVAPDDWNSFLKDCTEICISGDNMAAPGEVIINDVYLEAYPEGEEPYIPGVVEEEDPGRPDGDFVDLDYSHYHQGYPAYNVGAKKAMGDIIYGARFYDGWSTPDDYADLSAYSKLTIVATPGLPLTLTFNHQFDFAGRENPEDYTEDEEGMYEWIDAVVGEDGIYELDLTQFYPVHLNYIRIPWGFDKQGTVWYLLLTEREYITGDANGDGAVDVTDVVSIVNSILGKPSASFNAAAADVNSDGEVDITDVVAVVNIILGKRPNNAKAREAVAQSSTLTAMNENGNTNLVVDEAKNYVAMQLDVVLPEGRTLMDAQLNSTSNHAMVFNRTGENRYTVLAYSLSNEAFEPTNAALATLLTDGAEASIERATFITTDGRRISMDVSDMATGIANIQSKTGADGIYNLAGQRVDSSLKPLPAGIYLRNGKKIRVK